VFLNVVRLPKLPKELLLDSCSYCFAVPNSTFELFAVELLAVELLAVELLAVELLAANTPVPVERTMLMLMVMPIKNNILTSMLLFVLHGILKHYGIKALH